MEKNKIEITVKYLLKLIINHHFDLIFENDLFKKISKENFEEEVLSHPGKLTMPPIYQLNNLDFYETNFDNQVQVFTQAQHQYERINSKEDKTLCLKSLTFY